MLCACCLLGKFFGPDSCGHWGFQVKHVSVHWELALRNGARLGDLWGSQEGREQCSTMIYLSHLLGMGETVKRFIFCSTGDGTGEFCSRGTGGIAATNSIPYFLDLWVSRECLLDLGTRVEQQVGTARLGAGEGLLAPKEM